MIRTYVDSSNISSAGYDAAGEILEVEFSNGSVYQYFNVPPHLNEEFMAAPSKGKFLNQYIKNGYPYSRVG